MSAEPPYDPSIACEGAVARYEDVSIAANPYNPANNWHAWCSWRFGWDFARQLQRLYALRGGRVERRDDEPFDEEAA